MSCGLDFPSRFQLTVTKEMVGATGFRMLWDIIGAATGGAVTAKFVGADAKIGALTGATPQIIRSVRDAPSLFRRGAFDLAGRIHDAAASVVPMNDYSALKEPAISKCSILHRQKEPESIACPSTKRGARGAYRKAP